MQKRILFLVATVVMFITSAMAQVTTSGISGKVTMEKTGEEVIGATVQAVHVPSGTKYNAVTNIKGIYSIQGMRAGGPYTVTVSYIGAQAKTFENISLQLGETYALQVWLADDTQQLGEIVVTGEAGLAASRTGAAQTINNLRIQELPTISHSVADVARINPFVKVSESGAMQIAGANNRYNSIQIDGAVANDVFGLTANGANGGQAGTQAFSMETIDQLQVSIAPFDVRQSGFTGGAINAITKSGTNEFHGSVYSYYQDGGMVSNKYEMHNGKESADYGTMTDFTLGATLGGPIVKDKLFFFANWERTKKEYDNAYSSKGSASKVDFDVANNILNEVINRAAAQGITYRGTLGTPKEYTYSDKVGLKLDWNINDRNHASLRWSFVDAKQNNNTAGASSLVTNDYAYDFVSKTNSLVFELQSRIGSNMNNEFHASWTSVRDKRNPGDPFPMIQVSNVGGGTLYVGNERSSMANALNQDIYTITDNFTINAGRHAITIGTHDEFYKFGNLFCQDIYGTYIYSSPDDFFKSKINRYRYGQGNQAITGTKRWTPEFGAGQIGFYAQDKWSITDNFDLTYGLRIDMPFMNDTPVENKEFNDYAASQGWNVQTNHKIAMKPMWSPRVGFRWDVLGNKNLIVRGGVGIFTGRVPYVWLSNNFSNTGIMQMSYSNYPVFEERDGQKYNWSSVETEEVDGKTVNVQDADGHLIPTGTNIAISYDPNNQIGGTFVDPDGKIKQSAQTINVFDKDFKFSQSLRADLAVDFKALGINWTVEGIYSKTLNDMFVRNLDITATGKTLAETAGLSFDNRPMYETSTVPFSAIYKLENVNKGYSYNLSVKAEKSFNFGLDVMASYTYGQSKTINNGSSSVAASNFQYNYTHKDPNAPELETSNFNVPHQIMVSAYQHIKWNKNHQTTVGLIYTGNSGNPYSIYVNGDINGDGNSNDLMFIPTDAQVDEMLSKNLFLATKDYTAEQQAANFKEWLAGEEYLKDHRGEYFERNAANEKFEHRLDLHVDHKISFKLGKEMRSLTIGLDVINFTNMLNKSWGATLGGGGYNYYSPLTYNKDKYQFLHPGNYDMRSYSDYYSRWRMQLSAKFNF